MQRSRQNVHSGIYTQRKEIPIPAKTRMNLEDIVKIVRDQGTNIIKSVETK